MGADDEGHEVVAGRPPSQACPGGRQEVHPVCMGVCHALQQPAARHAGLLCTTQLVPWGCRDGHNRLSCADLAVRLGRLSQRRQAAMSMRARMSSGTRLTGQRCVA